jgi:L-seryl-tRNA(Ser) seleniumtransferase
MGPPNRKPDTMPSSTEKPTVRSGGLFRLLPKVDRVLEAPEIQPLLATHSRKLVLEALREELEELRERAADGSLTEENVAIDALRRAVETRLTERLRRYYRRVINGTGVILHTGLGRAPLPTAAVEALTQTQGHAQRVEMRLGSGRRGGRDRGCALLLEELLGCEAATVVNNNAAATLLALAALSRGRKVLLSRGEMVEIGGSYRVPEILAESGAILKEVGATNRTHVRDYVDAVDEEVGMILKVHTSNYRVVGFTREVEIAELVEIGREHGLPVVHDLGSGCLVDLVAHGRDGEPRVQDSLRAGADLVCFSGDKLLGGPQAGVLAGRREAVERCQRHPLFRAVRPGRLVYTALEATLRLYQQGAESALREVPALARLTASGEELERRAATLDGLIAARLPDGRGVEHTVERCGSQAGSGSLPAREIPSWAVRLTPREGSLEELAAALRTGDPPILARVRDDGLWLDVRTLEDDELPEIATRLEALFA